MLDVLLGAGIYNAAIVVTRYFGGVLLGTGGLVRAYSGAVQAGLAASTVIEKHHGISLQVTTDYTGIGKIQYIAGERSLPILDSEYTDKVVLKLLVPDDQIEEVKKTLTEGTNGRAGLEKDAELYFAKVNGEVKTFENKKRECRYKNTPGRGQMICVTVCSSRGFFLFQKIMPVSISPVPDNPHQRYQQSRS